MIIRLRQLAVHLTYYLAVVRHDDEYGVLIPRATAGAAQEVAHTPVCILHNLRLRFLCLGLKPRRNDVWRMIADGKERSHKRLLAGVFLARFVDAVEGVREEEMV